jgi:hypothetical protein
VQVVRQSYLSWRRSDVVTVPLVPGVLEHPRSGGAAVAEGVEGEGADEVGRGIGDDCRGAEVVEAVVADAGGRLVGQEGRAAPDVVLAPAAVGPGAEEMVRLSSPRKVQFVVAPPEGSVSTRAIRSSSAV